MNGKYYLLQVVHTLSSDSGTMNVADGREEERQRDCTDSEDHKDFKKGQSFAGGASHEASSKGK
jgi:hypothetical protein